MENAHSVKVLEQCQISPPSASVPRTSLPLTFFDMRPLVMPPVNRLFYYEISHTKTHFMNSVIPNIKHSLSLTLQHFFPLVGNLIWTPQSSRPEIHYVDGDSIPFTVAESNLNFNHVCGNHPRDVNMLYPLIPKLSPASDAIIPLLALQVTLFPNSGICVGISISHAVADGKSSSHFMKSWASVCKLNGDTSFMTGSSLPFYDRTMIKDPNEIGKIIWEGLEKSNLITRQRLSIFKPSTDPTENVQATFVIGRSEIDRLKRWIFTRIIERNNQLKELPFNLSSFVATCAHIWVCLMKTLGHHNDNVRENFYFAVGCRAGLDPPLPENYFGNCNARCSTAANKKDLLGEDGIAVAAEIIGNGIQNMRSIKGILATFHNDETNSFWRRPEHFFVTGGSPKLGVYETDFGWGRPKKVEMASFGFTRNICLSERSDGQVGLEVGLTLSKVEMKAFASHFSDTLKAL
ncbi:hypothetical protein GIB67_027936 [Kingdonia uniflora]|uniref:Uncharacterized protein n=1 Tax=Kingdonia uniflora TaxID=39325 RepID=A0A7J7LGS1_9MAGN|nr:hypothetical protein GIB67_027936 [Kingdonia uniflora]